MLTAVVAMPVCAAVYKWVDEDGRTRYTDTPPPDRRAETLRPLPAPAEDPDAERRQELLRQHLKEAEDQRHRQALEQKQRAEEQDARTENCGQARDRLEFLQSRPGPRLLTKEADGTMRRYTEEERQSAMTEAEARIAEYCGP